MLKGMAAGAVALLILIGIGGYALVSTGRLPANADAAPGRLENWAARTSLRATILREMPREPIPVPVDDANLEAGIRLYAEHCAVCHGASDGEASSIARGLYQHAPQLAKHGVEDDPEGETYWKVDHGIRFTGMPSFGRSLSARQIWQVVVFLKHMDSLPAGPAAVWKAVPTAARRPAGGP